MKQQSPYTVPEGFFEEMGSEVLRKTDAIRTRRRILGGACGTLAVAAIFSVALLRSSSPSSELLADSGNAETEEILETYEYDIFLNNY